MFFSFVFGGRKYGARLVQTRDGESTLAFGVDVREKGSLLGANVIHRKQDGSWILVIENSALRKTAARLCDAELAARAVATAG